MRLNWMDLDSARVAEPYMRILITIMETEDDQQLATYMEIYAALSDEAQCALGYMRCLLESSIGGSYSAYRRYCMDIMGRVPPMRLPLRFIGWGGEHNGVGPAYEIDGNCGIGASSKLFYTDDGIRGDRDAAEELARGVLEASSGIADVQAEQLEQLRTMDSDIRSAHWCVTFRLDDAALKEVAVNGEHTKPEAGKAFFILPKTGEFDCMLGEVVDGDSDNAFILTKHSYCMK